MSKFELKNKTLIWTIWRETNHLQCQPYKALSDQKWRQL